MYLWANVVFLFPAGWILDRISTKFLILTTMGICVLGTFIFATFSSFTTLYISRFFTGIGIAFCLLSCLRLVNRWFDNDKLALVTGVIITMGMFGVVFAQYPLTKMTEITGWRNALYINGIIGLVVMLLVYVVVKDYPDQNAAEIEKQKNKLKKIGILQSIKTSYFKLQNWFAAIYTSTMNMPIILLGAIFGTLSLNQCYQIYVFTNSLKKCIKES